MDPTDMECSICLGKFRLRIFSQYIFFNIFQINVCSQFIYCFLSSVFLIPMDSDIKKMELTILFRRENAKKQTKRRKTTYHNLLF